MAPEADECPDDLAALAYGLPLFGVRASSVAQLHRCAQSSTHSRSSSSSAAEQHNPPLSHAHLPFYPCNYTGNPLGYSGESDCVDAPPDEEPGLVLCAEAADKENAAAIGELLDRIARASPEEKVLNSLLYWLIDLLYKVMQEGEVIQPWNPEPYILKRPGVEARMIEEIQKQGQLLELLYCSEHYEKSRGSELLLQVKEVETTTTLLSSIQSSCAESCPEVIEDYNSVMRSPELTLQELERLEFDALGALLGLDGEYVMERAGSVRKSLSEWRNPELLFRYLEDNKDDEEMYELIKRWLRAIFGLSRRGRAYE